MNPAIYWLLLLLAIQSTLALSVVLPLAMRAGARGFTFLMRFWIPLYEWNAWRAALVHPRAVPNIASGGSVTELRLPSTSAGGGVSLPDDLPAVVSEVGFGLATAPFATGVVATGLDLGAYDPLKSSVDPRMIPSGNTDRYMP